MAGKMVFDQPGSPNARIENHGTITVREAGLATLVAPQVANSGVINAKLGHVILAGAKTATLDLYGDGLLSLDVSNQVTQAPVGADGKPVTALVTNTGVIVADGGTVQLTARAADGVVQNLVNAGGRIRAATVGSSAGTVALGGVGGSIVVEGQLSAPGRAPGTKGGAIEVVSDHDVTLASTARINASGQSLGGVVAIGTTLDRARGGPGVTAKLTAKSVTVRQGATIAANATGNGDGGRVAVLSGGTTKMGGAIAAKGGPSGGNGGFVEVSGNVLTLNGTADESAPLGQPGTLLLDPTFLDINQGSSGTGALDPALSAGNGTLASGIPNTGSNTVSNGEIQTLGSLGNVVLQTSTGTIGVHATINVLSGLSLEAGSDLLIDRGVTINAGRGLFLSSGTNIVGGTPTLATGSILLGTIGTLGPVSLSAPDVVIQAGSASAGHPAIDLSDSIINNGTGAPAGLVQLGAANGAVNQQSAGIINANTLLFGGTINNGITLTGTANAFTNGLFTTGSVTNGDAVLVDKSNLTLIGSLTANNLFAEVGNPGGTLTLGLFLPSGGTIPAALTTPAGGRISLVADNYKLATTTTPSSITAPGGTLELAPNTSSNANITVSQLQSSQILTIVNVGTTKLSTLVFGGFTDLPHGVTSPTPSAKNVTVDTTFDLATVATALNLEATNNIGQSAPIINLGTLLGVAGSATLTNPTNLIGTLGAFSTTTGFALVDNQALSVAGPVIDTGAASTLAVTTKTGDITLTGTVSATNIADLMSAGAINQIGGTLLASTLTGSATTSATLTQPTNLIGTLGAFSTTTGFGLVNDRALLVTGPVSDAGAASTLTLTTRTGDITLAGTVQAKNIVDLSSAGAIGEFGGIVIAGTLMGSAITGADFGTTPNAINTLGSFGVSGGAFILDDGGIAGNLTVSGPVSATNVSINDSGTITATGGVTASAGTLKLATAGSGGLLLNAGAILTGVTVDLDASGGGITEASGVINAATLLSSGGVTGNVQLTNLNSVGTLGNFSAGSFGLNDGTALLIAGALNAADIQIRAPASQISLGDGAIITTGGTTRPPGPLQAALEPANGGPGALLQATNFAQIGSSTVQGHGGSPATLQISTVGTVLFDPSLGLQAPGTWLILSLSNGMSGGNVFVSALDVTYTTPNSTNLFGTIAGITGGHAAAVGAIQPAVNNAYLFNSCVIGAAVCTNTPVTPPIIPTAPPIIPTAPVAVTPLNVGLTATLGAIEPLVTVPPPMLTAVPGMTLVALPMLQVRPPQLTDPDVVPPNISYLDY